MDFLTAVVIVGAAITAFLMTATLIRIERHLIVANQLARQRNAGMILMYEHLTGKGPKPSPIIKPGDGR